MESDTLSGRIPGCRFIDVAVYVYETINTALTAVIIDQLEILSALTVCNRAGSCSMFVCPLFGQSFT